MALTAAQKSSLLYKHYLGAGSTRINREFFEEAIKSSFVVRPDQIWAYGEMIPNGDEVSGGEEAIAKIRALGDGEVFTWNKSESEKTYPIVKCYKDFRLTKVDDGTDSSFLIADENGNQIRNIIPYNYHEDTYLYSLKTNDGTQEIAFGVGDWIVDIYSGIVTFYGELPEGVDHEHPPLLSFYQYVGAIGNRNDVNGYEAAVLPLVNVKIPYGSAVITKNVDTDETLYQLMVKKANEIEDNFVATYGFDGADKNEGIALAFQKVLPLLYNSTKDTVKGYDDSENSNIGTLLSSKAGVLSSDKAKISFVSHGTPTETYEIEIPAGKEGDLKKVALGNNNFCYVTLNEEVLQPETATITVVNTLDTPNPEISCALLYWDPIAYDYLPFINKEEVTFDFGFPVVAAQGKIPPSLILDTASLTQYADQVTPDYYGPRVATAVIARHDGNNIKSSDYIVKNTDGWYLDEKLAEVSEKYSANRNGKIFLRAGDYYVKSAANFTAELQKWNNLVLEGEAGVKIFVSEIVLENDNNSLIINNIDFPTTTKLTLNGNCNFTLVNSTLPLAVLTLKGKDSFLTSSTSFSEVHIEAVEDFDKPTMFRDCIVGTMTVSRNKTILTANTIEDLTITGEDVLVGNCYIGTLHSKTAKIYLEGSVILSYDTSSIAEENLNQLPVGSNNEKTSGRFPIFSKNDFKHLKYAEFRHPFHYNEAENFIELLYDSNTLSIEEESGKLKVSAKADALFMPNITYQRGDNATDDDTSYLAPKKYTNSDTISKVLEDLWHEKADLNENGKIPLQQLPDSVAYGGLQFVGMWSFEKNDNRYPTFSDVELNFSKDKDVQELQPGWFFIVSPAEDNTDSDGENDNPVNKQIAIDGEVFTAGDWVVYEGGDRWVKVDRAYSDPTFSPLPNKAMPTGEANKAWYWKNHRDGGALDLSGKTIITAFSDVNKELRKLQPKKPAAVSDTQLLLKDEDKIQTITYRQLAANMTINPKLITKIDLNKQTSITVKTCTSHELYKDLIYFGDSAVVSVDYDNTKKLNNYNITTESEDYSDENGITLHFSDSMLNADHGENYWKGFSAEFFVDGITEGTHTIKLAVSNVTINGEDATQDRNYGGMISAEYEFIKPFVQKTLVIGDTFTYFTDRIETLMNNGVCSGIRGLRLSDLGALSNISGSIKNVYYNGVIPQGRLLDLRAIINGDEENVLCERINADEYVSFIESSERGYQSMRISANLPITHNDEIILTKNDIINIIASVYDVYGEPRDIEVLTLNGVIRSDYTTEPERLTAGLLANDSTFDSDHFSETAFGYKYPSIKKCTDVPGNALLKIGRVINEKLVSEYKWPSGLYIDGVDYNTFIGEEIDGKYYAVACFCWTNSGKFLDEASGFTMKFNFAPDMEDKFIYNNLNGSTKNMKIQCCVVDSFGKKVTGWLDCNKANNGFSIPKNFGDAAMYAGLSNATQKRVTFGKGKYTGDLYIRVGIEQGSEIAFTGIEVTEVI